MIETRCARALLGNGADVNTEPTSDGEKHRW